MAEEKRENQDGTEKRPVGRPPLEWPEPPPISPEEMARILMNTSPDELREWREKQEQKCEESQECPTKDTG